jgi:TonB-linked SusC/RagA family outer membrane protein
MFQKLSYSRGRVLALAALTLFLGASTAFAQQSRVEGTVRNAQTRDPVENARVSVVGTNLFALTNLNGYYAIENVPVGTYDVRVQVIGYQSVVYTNQRVTAGLPTTVNFQLQPSILRIEGVVVTGVAEETAAVKLPFTVEAVGSEELPVPPVSAEGAIRGKVSGVKMVRNNGTPGGGITVMLRGATSINTSGRSNEPLYVVDGVILGQSMVDVDALDIESVEVVKGAAAAALYGARAANGVISIQTRRGSEIPDGETSIVFRSEFGKNNIENLIPVAHSHWYAIEDGQWKGTITTTSGTDTTLVPIRNVAQRETDWQPLIDFVYDTTDPGGTGTATENRYYVSDNEFPGPTYNHLSDFFNPGGFYTNSLSVSHRTGSTNFRASAHETTEKGVVDWQEGYTRRGVRLNVDHRIGRAFDFYASAYYAQSIADYPSGGQNDAFYDFNFYPIDTDLTVLNPEAQDRIDAGVGTARDSVDFLIAPDPQVQEANPLYTAANSDFTRIRGRVLGSLGVRWRPTDVFDLKVDFSYDRSDRNTQTYYFKGYRTFSASPQNDGQLTKTNANTQALNASADLTYTDRWGDLAGTFKLRGLIERQQDDNFDAQISNFTVQDVVDLDVGETSTTRAGSGSSAINSLGAFLSADFDYKDRYILDALVRRDGSSLFGADNRWATYYRIGLAYRLSQESFFNLSWVPEFKLRASLGTAGGRPRFNAQYETYNVSAGQVSKGNLGNKDLKPEKATELELGADIILFGNISTTVTYARSKVEDQLLLVPLAGVYGFSNQWRNAGTLESNTWEGSIQWSILQQADVGWNLNFVIDRTRQKITDFELPAYQTGGGYYYVRDGEILGTMYGHRWAVSCEEILTESGFNAPGVCDQFDLNDDGYLVPVGAGNSYQDGILNNYFGSHITIDGVDFQWGRPVKAQEIQTITLPTGELQTDTTTFVQMGHSQPDFNFGFGNNVRYKGFALYVLFDAQIGGDIYNNTRQWALRDGNGWEYDQRGKADGNKKEYDYYQVLYNTNDNSSHFVEDGTNMKLRELSLRYTFNRGQLENVLGGFFKRITVAAIGRNLLTFTGYTGYDPEVSNTGDGAVYRVDAFEYPNYRTFTGSVEVEF